jgi:hypothetical protein
MMRILIIVTFALAALWGGYWVVGRMAVEKQGVAFLEQLSDNGWQVGYESLETHGFPSRFDTTVTGLDLTDPSGTYGWQTPIFQILALSYQPHKIIAVWPEDQRLMIAGRTISVSSERLRASASVTLGTAPALDTVTAEVGAVALQSDAGWAASSDRGLLALRPASDTHQTYDAYFDTHGLVLPLELRERLDPAGSMPAAINLAKFDSTLTFDRPLDTAALAGSGPILTTMGYRDVRLVWGDMVLAMSGNLYIDADGQLSGKLQLAVTGWDQMVSLGVNAGLIHPADEATWRSVGASLAQGANTVDVPLTVDRGQVWLGMFPIASLPAF